jgi:F0F1-type ATP synthase membrane subunit b/b'
MAVPGKAGIAGVPVDRAAVLREELAPIFAALRAMEGEADDVVSKSTAESESRRQNALVAAQQILASANDDLVIERAAAARASEVETATSCSHLQAAADEEVRRIDAESASKVTLVVDELVRRVLSESVSSKAPS